MLFISLLVTVFDNEFSLRAVYLTFSSSLFFPRRLRFSQIVLRFLFSPIFSLIVWKACFLLWFQLVFGMLNSTFLLQMKTRERKGNEQESEVEEEAATCCDCHSFVWEAWGALANYILSIHYFNWFIVLWNCYPSPTGRDKFSVGRNESFFGDNEGNNNFDFIYFDRKTLNSSPWASEMFSFPFQTTVNDDWDVQLIEPTSEIKRQTFLIFMVDCNW